MKARLVGFGALDIDGNEYRHDVVIDRGRILERDSTKSQSMKPGLGHTPLTVHENIPWNCKTLLIGNGVYGRLPVTDEVKQEAERRGVKLVIGLTREICKQLSLDPPDANAILHCTC